MLKKNFVSVVTPTWNRHKEIINCIEQVKCQNFDKPYEHIIVSDGQDDEIETICSYYGIRCKCIEKEKNTKTSRGHAARDVGIEMATGEYVVLWDDDNIYFNNAISSLYLASRNFDIGICDIHFRMRPPDSPLTFARKKESKNIYCTLPKKWSGCFELRNIDTMNVMVKKNIAKLVKWTDSKEYEGDFYWLNSLHENDAKINYVPTHIGIKL